LPTARDRPEGATALHNPGRCRNPLPRRREIRHQGTVEGGFGEGPPATDRHPPAWARTATYAPFFSAWPHSATYALFSARARRASNDFFARALESHLTRP